MRARLAKYARSRVGTVLGLAGTVLVAASDHLFGIPSEAHRHVTTMEKKR